MIKNAQNTAVDRLIYLFPNIYYTVIEDASIFFQKSLLMKFIVVISNFYYRNFHNENRKLDISGPIRFKAEHIKNTRSHGSFCMVT